MATRDVFGAISFNVSRILPKTENSTDANPVTLPPGRARLLTYPDPTASAVPGMMTGTVLVNCSRTGITRPPRATMTSGFSSTRLAALARTRSILSVVQRSSNSRLPPRVQPSLLQLLLQCADAGFPFGITWGVRQQNPDAPHPVGLLRANMERPYSRCTAEECDELPSSHYLPRGLGHANVRSHFRRSNQKVATVEIGFKVKLRSGNSNPRMPHTGHQRQFGDLRAESLALICKHAFDRTSVSCPASDLCTAANNAMISHGFRLREPASVVVLVDPGPRRRRSTDDRCDEISVH